MGVELSVRKRLSGFDLDVQWQSGGGTTALFGFSGAGKTMTLRLIAGLMRPDSGYIRVNGESYFDSMKKIDIKSHHRSIGYVFQDYALFPHMDVRKNIGYGLARKVSGDKEANVREMIGLFSLGGLEGSLPRELSGGQKQRVALARALIGRPSLLMLDEPFSALDRPLRVQARSAIMEARAAFGIPVIMVTHDFSEVRNLADEAIVYVHGRVAQAGPPDMINRDPASPEVKSLVGIG